MSTDNNTNKLGAKDFITVGIFTAILFVVEFACGMLGFIHPYIVASYVILIPLVGSIPMMLFYTKVGKFGMITIMSVLMAIIMFVTGMGWLGAPLIILAGVIADLIARSGQYKSFNKTYQRIRNSKSNCVQYVDMRQLFSRYHNGAVLQAGSS